MDALTSRIADDLRGRQASSRFVAEPRDRIADDCAILQAPGLGPPAFLWATSSAYPRIGVRRRPMHSHDAFHLIVVTEGRCSFPIAGELTQVQAPSVVLIPPGEPHTVAIEPEDRVRFATLTFTLPNADPTPDWSGLMSCWTGLRCELPRHQPLDHVAVTQLSAAIEACVRHGKQGHPQLAVLLQGFMAETFLMLHRHLVAAPQSHGDEEPAAIARRWIEQRATEPFALADVARQVALSPKHLSRLFRARFGIAPMRYRRQVLMHRAATLLTTTGSTLGEIAQQLGFEDVRYFIRCFKQEHGLPPGRWQRTARA